MINGATNQFKRLSSLRGHWSIRGPSTERQVGLIPTHLIEIRGAQTVWLPSALKFQMSTVIQVKEIDEKLEGEEVCGANDRNKGLPLKFLVL